MTLTRRLLLSYIAVIATTAAVLTVAAERDLRSRLEAELTTEFEREARYLARAVRTLDPPALDSLVHELGAITGRRLTIIARDGRVIADSDFPRERLAALENHATRPEVAAALAGRTGVDSRRSASTGEHELKVAVPGGPTAAVVRVSARLDQVDGVVRNAQKAVLGGAFVAVLVAIVLALGFSRNVARPLRRLSDAAQAIARGEHPALDTRGRSEVGQLARALRKLDEDLATRLGELKREQSETEALIASMVEGVIACDEKGRVTMMNPAARTLLDLGTASAVPPVQELFRQRHALEGMQDLLRGTTVAGLEVETGQRVLLLSGRPLPRGGAVLVAHDVTELKRFESMRRDFVANVSHELKTPLTVLRGYTETLLADDPGPDVRARFLKAILDHAQRMQRLVDDLLDLSRIEAGAWQPQPARVALAALAREVWESLSGATDAGSLDFHLEIAPDAETIVADPDMLREALANLLENAIRHTPAGGRISVQSARAANEMVVTVSDTGEGIPSEHLPRIFERFYRADAGRDRALGGTGLGLAIVKHITEKHGGRVAAQSTVGQGTAVSMVFPATTA